MTIDDVTNIWRSQDISPLYGVDESQLHLVLRQERAKQEKLQRRWRWATIIASALLLVTAALCLAIMIDPYDDDQLIVWDYVVGGLGLAAAIVLMGALFVLYRSRQTREQGFGDSVRDHLRRSIAQIDAEAHGERRLVQIIAGAVLIGAWAIAIIAHRIADDPWGQFNVLSLPIILVVIVCVLAFRRTPHRRERNLSRKRQLEALLQELDSQ